MKFINPLSHHHLVPIVFAIFTILFSISAFAVPSGGFRVPTDNQTFTGNLMFGGTVTDTDGSGRLRVRFNRDSSKQINICSNCFSNSSNTRNFVRAGVNPRDLGLNSGTHTAQLIEIDDENETIVDTVSFRWSPEEIENVSVNRTIGNISIGWASLSGYTSYNLYVASEPSITPDSAENLPDATIFRGLVTTSQNLTDYADDLGLFGLVTGNDFSGESAYSEVFRIEALDNQDPTVISEEFTLDEDSTIEGNVLENDEDPEGGAITAELVAQPINGEATLDAEGNFTYTPNEDFNGTDSFSYTVTDPQGGSDLGSITFTINPINDDPEPADDVYETLEDETLDVSTENGVLINDTDADNDPLTVELTTQAINGEVSLASDGAFSYQPAPKFFGEDSFEYTVSDGQQGINTATVNITVLQVNDLPIAEDDFYELIEDTGVTTDVVTGVLSNDTDEDAIDGDIASELTVSLVSDVQNGSLALSTDGSFSYMPNGDFFGTDSFEYLVTDSGGQTDNAFVAFDISEVNDEPEAGEDSFEINEDNELLVSAAEGVLSNDTDVEDSQEQLSATVVNTTSNGTLQLNSDGSFSYLPNPDYFGEDSFVYQVLDSQQAIAEQTATISILPVNDPPVAMNDEYTFDEDQQLTISEPSEGLLANDSDPDLPEDSRFTGLIVSLVTPPGSGDLSLQSNGSFSFLPDNNFSGQLSFSYAITDQDNASAQASVTLIINDLADTPITTEDSYSIEEDFLLEVSSAEGILANDQDGLGGNNLTVSVIESTQFGSLSLNSDGSFSYQPNDDFFGTDGFTYQVVNESELTATGSVALEITPVNDLPATEPDELTVTEGATAEITPLDNDTDVDGDELNLVSAEPQLGSLSVTDNVITYLAPEIPAGQNAVDTITYVVSDGSENNVTGTISVTIEELNNSPDAQDDSAETLEDTSVTITPLDNDSDPDGDELNFVVDSVTNGSIEVTGETVTFAPEENFNGTAEIGYTVSDLLGASASATISVEVTPVNDLPTAEDDSFSVNEGATVTFSPLTNDSDVEDEQLTITSVSASVGTVTHNGTEIEYTAPQSPGTDTISYTISDSEDGTASAVISVTISDVNNAPDAGNDEVTTNEDTAITINILDNDSDADGDALIVSIDAVQNGTASLSGNNSLVFTPEQDFNGAGRVDYTISDPSNATDSAEVVINVLAVNDAPVPAADSASVNEGASVEIDVLSNDTDVENDDLTITNPTASSGSVSLSSDSKTLTYTAPTGLSADTTETISYFVSDGSDTSASSGIVTVSVTNINNAPTAVADTASVNAGETATLDVLANDSDADGESFTITQVSTANVGSVSISTDALSLSYTAPSDTTDSETLSYTITDASGATASSTVTVNISEQTFSGDFDTDGDGNNDVSASTDGTDYTVTFGDDVDAVYYEENGEVVSLSANDSGVYELTIQGTSSGNKPGGKNPKRPGVKTSLANLDFVLPNNTNQVFYTIDGTEYSFTVSNLDQPNANVAFGPPQKLDTDFGSSTSHDFFLRQQSFTGPLRFGVINGEHYVLNSDGTGFVQGSNFDHDVTWLDANGSIVINILNPQEEQLFINVYDLDDDNSDGIALNVITRAEADAYVASKNTNFVEVFSTDLSQIIQLVSDNKVYVQAQIFRYASYRIDATTNPEITSANSGVAISQPVEVMNRQLWDIENLKVQDISFSDIQNGIATDIPRINSNQFDSFVADICSFVQDSITPNTGTGDCDFNDQSFSWQINNKILTLDFGNDIVAEYRWIDKLAVENTFAINLSVGSGTSQSRYSRHAYWLELQNLADASISSLLTGNYFDSASSKTNPDARDSNKDINTGDIFGYYFANNGLAKNILSFNRFTGDQLFDTDQTWQLSNGDIKITSLSSFSSPNATFRYFYDQCTDTANEDCFAWEVREWHPIAIDTGKLWVWETVIQNQEGPNFNGAINYFEQTAPQIQFYEFNNNIPGAPNSISFNQEPTWNSPTLNTEINTPLNNVDLSVFFSDPESDPINVQDVFVDSGGIQKNNDNTVTFTPENNFTGTVNLIFSVSDGTNIVFAFGTINVLTQNVPPVAVDDTVNAATGITETITPLSNDTDQNGDQLLISNASAVNGNVTLNNDQSAIEYTSNSNFVGADTINYTIEDGRGGSDTGVITVNVTQPQFAGSYDFDNSNNPDFTISTDGTDFYVEFSGEVTAVFYTLNGKVFPVTQNANGNFDFQYDGTSTDIALLSYIINGVRYTISPDNLTATTPNLVYAGATILINAFGSSTSYELISRSPVTRAPLSTSFENGNKYSLISNGTGTYSSPSLSDDVNWSQSNGTVTVSFNNPSEVVVFFNVYDLDDENNNDGSLGVITKAEADAYVANNNNNFVDVYVSTTSHEISATSFNGYYYDTQILFNQTLRIDSSSHPEITSASSGVPVSFDGSQFDLLDTSRFDFIALETSRVTGQIYLPVPVDDGSGNFETFMSDVCSLSETTFGSNSGSGSCSLTGSTINWLINADGSMDVVVTSTSGFSASYHAFSHGRVEDTVFVEVTDINGHKYSTLDYWASTTSVSASDVSSLLAGNYMETSDNVTNPFNYNSDGELNDHLGFGFYFDNSGFAKELRTSIDPTDNSTIVDDSDRQWNVASASVVDIFAVSNLSSSDTFKYQYSQCTNSNDQDCYIWSFRNWQPIAIDGNRIWVLDSEFDDTSGGFYAGTPNYVVVGTPKIRFYDIRSAVPGLPNSTSFNQHPVLLSNSFNATENTAVIFNVLAVIGDPESDTVSLLDANVNDGTVTVNNDNTITFTPSNNFVGTTHFDIKVSDGINEVTLNSFISVAGANIAPVATDDNENAVGSHSYVFNVLTNDTDGNGDSLTITGLTTIFGGFSIGTGSTTIEYNAPASLTTTATVTYDISDGNGGTDSATLTVNLVPNSAPSVQNDSGSVNAGGMVNLTPLANDSDPDGDAIEINSASSSDGSVVIAGDKQSLDFTPSISSGTANITYEVIDGFGGSTNGSISVTVNSTNTPPVAVDDTLNTTPLTMVNFDPRGNDTDADSDSLTIISASAINGSAVPATGNLSIDYTSPSTGHSDTITYVISDGNGGQDTGQIIVTINTAPTATATNEAVAPSSVTAFTPSISDADGDSFTVTAASTGTGSVTFSGTNINYTAPATETSATISYTVEDGFGGSVSSTINVTINHIPVAITDSYTLSIAGTTGTSPQTIYVPTESGVITNDSDASSADTHTVTVGTLPSFATAFTLNNDGSFQYEHNGTANYSDSFTYTLSDGYHSVGPVSVALSIIKENWQPRVCTFPRRYIPAGEVLNQEIRVADYDNDGQSFSISGNPSWMQINIDGGDNKKAFITSTETGGIVPTANVGTTYNLSVTSNDGYESSSISFDMTVTEQFGTNNVREQAFGGIVETVHDATVDSLGRIVFVGSSDGDVAVSRLLPGGTFDGSFNGGSPVIIDIGGTSDVAMAVTTTPTGAIYIGGYTNADTDADSLIISLNENGTVNSGFNGGNGDGGTRDAAGIEVIHDSASTDDDVIEDIHYLDTGHILIVGQTDTGSATNLFVGHYNTTGLANTSWDAGDGFVTISGATRLIPRKSRLSKEGTLYIVGDALNAGAQDIFVTRIKMNGTGQDSSFNGGSVYYLDDSSGNEEANDFVFDNNGNLIIAGMHNSNLALYYRALSGTDDGTISTPATFNGGTDKLILDLNSGSTDEAYSIVSDKRGNYYVAAKSNAETKAIKISANGSQDGAYGGAGIKDISLTSGDSTTETVLLRDARGQLLFFDVEDPSTDDHIQITSDFILDPPVFGSCPSTGTEVAKTVTSSADKSDDTTITVSEYADGRYYVVGYSIPDRTTSRKLFAAAKVHKEGSLESNFSDGFTTVDGGSVSSIRAQQALTVEDNNLIITGFDNSATFNFFMAKLLASGELDTSFDSDGRRDFGGALKLQPAGMLYDGGTNDFLVAGKTDSGYASIYRFNSDGSDDTGFGAGASALSTADAGANYTTYTDANFITSDVFQLADTNIYQVGQLFVSDQEVAVMQLDSSGLLQTAYGTSGVHGGITHYSDSSNTNIIASVDTDGTHFYVLNHNNAGATSTARIFKIVASTGQLDTSYGTNGIVTLGLPNPSTGTLVTSQFDSGNSWSIRVDASGNQWVMLYTDSAFDGGTSDSPYLIKLNSNGHFASDFVNGGYTRLTHNIANWSQVTGIEVDSSNNVFIYGYSGSDFYFALANSNGTINSETPVTSLDLGDGTHNFDIAMDEYSGINLAGASFNDSDLDANRSLTRFDNSGTPDSSFGSLGSDTAIEIYSTFTDEVSTLNAVTLSGVNNLYVSGSSFPEGASTDTDISIGRVEISGATLEVTDYPALSNINNTTGVELVGSQYLADNGSLFVAGSTGTLASVYKYDSTGTLSTTFNSSSTAGYIHVIEVGDHHFHDIVADGNGGFIAVGYVTNGGHDNGLIARFTDSSTTALDSGFGGDGVVQYDVSSKNERFTSVAVGSDGTIYAVGYSNYEALIVAYDSSGNLVNRFTGSTVNNLLLDFTGGASFTGTENLGIQAIVDIEVDAYGALMMLARVENGFTLARYSPDGNLITNYGGLHHVSHANKLRAFAIDSLGNVYLTGSAQIEARWVSFVVRFPNAVGPY